MPQERPGRPSRHPKKKQRVQAEPELSESDEYVDFAEPRHEPMAEFNAVIVGDETETSSAVQSIQQVDKKIFFNKSYCFIVIITGPIFFFFFSKTTRNGLKFCLLDCQKTAADYTLLMASRINKNAQKQR